MRSVFHRVIVVGLVLSGMTACATSTAEAPAASDAPAPVSLDSQAQGAYTAENWPETARLYGLLLVQNAANARYWYRLAVAQRYLGDLDQALASLDSGVNVGLPVSFADYERAKVAATRGDAVGAISLLESAAAGGLSGKERVLDNDQLAALKGTKGFDAVLDQLDANAFPCRDSAFQEFDFWLGTWDVRTANDVLAGRNRITARENGCMLLEEWSSASGGSGTSINYYDAISGEWTQIWISPGLQLNITGGLVEGSMVLTGRAHYIQQGNTAAFRGTWTPMEDGRVRQFFEQQDAEGNWSTWFEGFYTKVPESEEQSD